ncbi:single-stranded-DNA-specific exonuclease RecJ, partial [Dehalococcoidia bacterium]|nr:single-stranded-DNA-specific exonuclease RecJ [Dehalococcoidia bacterium]
VTGTAVMVRALGALNAEVLPYIPHRVDEGHGLNSTAITGLRDQGVKLLITVDCGVTSRDEIGVASDMGIDTIVTDHHAIIGEPPEAIAVVSPRTRNSVYPYADLTGVGMAFKLVQALFTRLGKELPEGLLELVALGTIADVGPLTGENRYFVNEGLARLNTTSSPGIRALTKVAGLTFGTLDETSLAFGLIPRLNAPGRLAHASASLDLLTTADDKKAQRLAEQLQRHNQERQTLTERGITQAEAQIRRRHPDGIPSIIVVGSREWLPGILGIIAGRLAEAYYRPAIAVNIGNDLSRASARSIQEFDMVKALSVHAGMFTRFGGHAQAAGFEIPTYRMRELVDGLTSYATSQIGGRNLQPELTIDCVASPSEIEGENFTFIRRLSPFGANNPSPLFAATGARVLEKRTVGQGRHLRLRIGHNRAQWDAIAFRQGARDDLTDRRIDFVYSMERNEWRGRTTLQLVVEDLRPASD